MFQLKKAQLNNLKCECTTRSLIAGLGIQTRVKRLACNRTELNSLLLLSSYADAQTQHDKKVDRYQNGKMNKFIFHKQGRI